MENFRQWRDEKAKDLKAIPDHKLRKESLETLKTSGEYKESKVSLEKERKERTISDQALEYFNTHHFINDITSKEKIKEILRLIPEDGSKSKDSKLTFNKRLPLLMNSSLDPYYINGLGKFILKNQEYFDAKKNWSMLTEQEREDAYYSGPLSHGGEVLNLHRFFRAFIYPGLDGYLNNFKHLLIMNDHGTVNVPEIESDFKKVYDNFIDISSRMLTLITRDPKWSFSDLKKFLINKLGEEVLKDFELEEESMKFQEIFAPDIFDRSKREYPIELIAEANRASALMVKVFQAADDYFREKVVYPNEVAPEASK